MVIVGAEISGARFHRAEHVKNVLHVRATTVILALVLVIGDSAEVTARSLGQHTVSPAIAKSPRTQKRRRDMRESLQSELPPRVMNRVNQRVDFGLGVVERKAGARGRGDVEPFVQRHRAMMTGSDSDSL